MAKKRLGQNFLYDPGILHRIVDAAEVGPEDTVVEIGPGHGRMTGILAQRAWRVIAIELDEALHAGLRRELSDVSNVEPVHMDCLKYPYENLDRFKVVANIPYYITTPIIFRLLEAGDRLTSLTLTVQKEVAERIVAGPGSRDYGVLSIAVQIRSTPKILFTVPRGAFRPPPRVDSAVIQMRPLAGPRPDLPDERYFMNMVRTVFSRRRKTILNGLKGYAPPSKLRVLLAELGIPADTRPEMLGIEDLARLALGLKRLAAN